MNGHTLSYKLVLLYNRGGRKIYYKFLRAPKTKLLEETLKNTGNKYFWIILVNKPALSIEKLILLSNLKKIRQNL